MLFAVPGHILSKVCNSLPAVGKVFVKVNVNYIDNESLIYLKFIDYLFVVLVFLENLSLLWKRRLIGYVR